MPSVTREFFTVDLRGLRNALAVRAAHDGTTESDVLRSAVAAALGQDASATSVSNSSPGAIYATRQTLKLSIRLSYPSAQRLDQNARAVGLSRGAYLMRLINGAPPVMASTDRAAGFAALSASANELALLSRDIHHLTKLLRQGDVKAARAYADRHEHLDADVRAHLDLAATALADLAPGAARRLRPSRTKASPPRSNP